MALLLLQTSDRFIFSAQAGCGRVPQLRLTQSGSFVLGVCSTHTQNQRRCTRDTPWVTCRGALLATSRRLVRNQPGNWSSTQKQTGEGHSGLVLQHNNLEQRGEQEGK